MLVCTVESGSGKVKDVSRNLICTLILQCKGGCVSAVQTKFGARLLLCAGDYAVAQPGQLDFKELRINPVNTFG
jgi:hypothetical protein